MWGIRLGDFVWATPGEPAIRWRSLCISTRLVALRQASVRTGRCHRSGPGAIHRAARGRPRRGNDRVSLSLAFVFRCRGLTTYPRWSKTRAARRDGPGGRNPGASYFLLGITVSSNGVVASVRLNSVVGDWRRGSGRAERSHAVEDRSRGRIAHVGEWDVHRDHSCLRIQRGLR